MVSICLFFVYMFSSYFRIDANREEEFRMGFLFCRLWLLNFFFWFISISDRPDFCTLSIKPTNTINY